MSDTVDIPCAECGRALSVMESWASTPADDKAADDRTRTVQRAPTVVEERLHRVIICNGCYNRKDWEKYAGTDRHGWNLVAPRRENLSQGMCKFCGARGSLIDGYCSDGCSSIERQGGAK